MDVLLVHEDPYGKGRCGSAVLEMLLRTHQPLDLIIMMLGTNDLKTMYHLNAEMIAKGVRENIKIMQNPFLYERYAILRFWWFHRLPWAKRF